MTEKSVTYRKSFEGQQFKVSYSKKTGMYKVWTKDTLNSVYEDVCDSFLHLGDWISNMSDNHDISRAACNWVCDKFGKTFDVA